MKNGISAVLIVKNEEKVLDRCLRSLAGCDEIAILDTGSTDRTLEIARAHTSVVAVSPPIEPFHFAEARNRAERLATQDWVLTIDADEILEEGAMSALRRTVRTRPQSLGFRVLFKLSDQDGQNESSLMKLKVYRRGFWTWAFRVHEQLFPLGEGQIHDIADASMRHLPDPDKEHRRRQNLELLKLSVEEDPGYLRNWRQLGMEEILLGRHEEAIPHLRRYLEGKGIDPLDRSETRVHIARAIAKRPGGLEEALSEFDQATLEAPDRREPHVYKALALVNVARLDDAIVEVRRCLAIPVEKKPNFHLNVESIWNGSFPGEILEFCEKEIHAAKMRFYAGERPTG